MVKLVSVEQLEKKRERNNKDRAKRNAVELERYYASKHTAVIYVIPHPYLADHVKIGRSENIVWTERSLNRGDPYKSFKATHTWTIGTAQQAHEIEKSIHYRLNDYRVVAKRRGEWFRLSVDEAVSFINQIIPLVGGLNAANDNRMVHLAVA